MGTWSAPTGRPSETDYAWIIDVDHLAEPGASPGSACDNAASIMGPHNAPDELCAFLGATLNARQGTVRIDDQDLRVKSYRFTMRDDDGELYYAGRMVALVTGDPHGVDEEACAAPLQDFGTPNAGATEISYHTHSEMNVG